MRMLYPALFLAAALGSSSRISEAAQAQAPDCPGRSGAGLSLAKLGADQPHLVLNESFPDPFVARFGNAYTHRIFWVAPGLTHRSFVIAREERAAHGIPAARTAGAERLALTGANDLLPPGGRITALPTRPQCTAALARLAARLGTTTKEAAGHFGRGGGGATPLALPELLDDLLTEVLPPALAGAA